MGRHIRSLRLDRAWSQEHLADLAGVSVRTIQRLEQGHPASLETTKALAAAFDVPASHVSAPSHTTEEDLAMTDATLAQNRPATTPWGGFKRTLILFAGINAGLAGINAVFTPDHWWFVYPLAGWGLAVVLKAVKLRWPA